MCYIIVRICLLIFNNYCSLYNKRDVIYYYRGRKSERGRTLQNLLGRTDRVCHFGVWSHGLLHQLWQANVRVSDMQAVRRPCCKIL